MIKTIIIHGPFTQEDFNLLVGVIRDIDNRHPNDTFQVIADDDGISLEDAEAVLKAALPPSPGRISHIVAWAREEAAK